MNDAQLMDLAENYLSSMAGGDVINSIRIHANIAGVNTKHVVFQGLERVIVYNVFKAANSQKKLEELLSIISADTSNVPGIPLYEQPKIEVQSWARYLFIGNAFIESEYELLTGHIINPSPAPKRAILKTSISGCLEASLISVELPENGKIRIPRLRIPRFTQDELNLISRSIFPTTITAKLSLVGNESPVDVFQAETLISQPDFVLIARELSNGSIEDHFRILPWLVNSGAKGIGKFLETKIIPKIGKQTGYQSTLNYSMAEIKEFSEKQAIAIYDGLNDLNLTFVPTELLVTGQEGKMILQRVQNPENLLTGTSTYVNCLDGVILFASILERLNLDPIIVLLPGHSLVGWRCYPGIDSQYSPRDLLTTCEFVDIALISEKLGFYEALSSAEAYLLRNMPLFEHEPVELNKYARIIDVRMARK